MQPPGRSVAKEWRSCRPDGITILIRVTEQLFLLVFRVVRSTLLMQGLAVVMALLATTLIKPDDAPHWLTIALRTVMLVSATLFVAGVLMAAARRVSAASADAQARSTGAWPVLLALSLVAVPALAYAAAIDLLPLWREIAELLDRIGFWQAFARADPFAGIVILPILAALLVPILETTAAFFLMAVPMALVILLLTRRRMFPTLFAMLMACQVGLVVASLLAADGLSRLAAEAMAAMPVADDVEVDQVVDFLRRAQDTLNTTARALVAPMLAYMAWLPFLLWSRSVGGFFVAGGTAAATSVPVRAQHTTSSEPVAVRLPPAATSSSTTRRDHLPVVSSSRTTSSRAGIALIALGAFILAFSAREQLRPRAHSVSVEPAPGATLASAPSMARVTLDRALDPSSSLSVRRMTGQNDSGDDATVVARTGGIAAGDAEHRTLMTDLSGIPDGRYHAAWIAVPDSGGIVRHGSYYFRVGAVAYDAATADGPLEEHDAGERRRRHTFAGGVVLLALGALSLVFRR